MEFHNILSELTKKTQTALIPMLRAVFHILLYFPQLSPLNFGPAELKN